MLNISIIYSPIQRKYIQIQHLLMLNDIEIKDFMRIGCNSNTTLVNVKSPTYVSNLVGIKFKYNTC